MANLNLFVGTTLKSLRYFTGVLPSKISVTSVCRPPAFAHCHGSIRSLPINRKMSTDQQKVEGLSEDALKECVKEPDDSTKDFIFQQTMYRIKDPKKSLQFYTEVLGMRLLQKFDFPQWTFSLYFMGYEDPKNIPEDRTERTCWMFKQKGCLELTHNWGTENDENLQYHNGNSDPRGYGHIGIHVPDVRKACERFEKLGVKFVKRPDDGNMKGLAFIEDPDGYRIEILSSNQMAKDIK